MSFSTKLCEPDCGMDIGKMPKLTQSPYFRPWWEIITWQLNPWKTCDRTYQLWIFANHHHRYVENSSFSKDINVGWDVDNLFEPAGTLVSDAGHWIWSVVSPLSLIPIRILSGAKGLISINSYIGAWLWRELKAANSYKGAAPLALAWEVSSLYAALSYYNH